MVLFPPRGATIYIKGLIFVDMQEESVYKYQILLNGKEILTETYQGKETARFLHLAMFKFDLLDIFKRGLSDPIKLKLPIVDMENRHSQ